MGIVGRLDQYASMLAGEFDDYSMSENLLTYSKDFSSGWSSSLTVTLNNAIAPDGTLTAAKIQRPANSGNSNINQNPSLSTSTNYCYSAFIKLASTPDSTYSVCSLSSSNAGIIPVYASISYNFVTGAISTFGNLPTISGVIPYPNGWYRLYMVINTSSQTNASLEIRPLSNNLVSDFYIWGAQLEVGSVATDYTPTTTTAKTRVLSSTTNTNITGLSTYFSSGFSENIGAATTLVANVFPPYDLVYDDFGGTLFGAGQGRYMRQNTDKSVIVYNEIDEVTDFYSRGVVRAGLVLDLDAGVSNSYPGTGTTWTDLSPYGNNGELVNSPTYNSSNSGYFQFVTDDFARMQNNTALDTQTPSVEVWVKTNATTQNGFWFEKGEVNTQYSLFQEGSVIQWRMNIGGITNLSTTTATYMNTSNWYQVVGTYTSGTRRLYINGTRVNSDSQSGTIATNAGGMSIGVYGGFNGGRGYYYNGNLAVCRVYNRALTAAEIKQNYDATKGRFGL